MKKKSPLVNFQVAGFFVSFTRKAYENPATWKLKRHTFVHFSPKIYENPAICKLKKHTFVRVFGEKVDKSVKNKFPGGWVFVNFTLKAYKNQAIWKLKKHTFVRFCAQKLTKVWKINLQVAGFS